MGPPNERGGPTSCPVEPEGLDRRNVRSLAPPDPQLPRMTSPQPDGAAPGTLILMRCRASTVPQVSGAAV